MRSTSFRWRRWHPGWHRRTLQWCKIGTEPRRLLACYCDNLEMIEIICYFDKKNLMRGFSLLLLLAVPPPYFPLQYIFSGSGEHLPETCSAYAPLWPQLLPNHYYKASFRKYHQSHVHDSLQCILVLLYWEQRWTRNRSEDRPKRPSKKERGAGLIYW